QHGRQNEQKEREDEQHEVEHERRGLVQMVQRDVNMPAGEEQPRHGDAVEADARFEDAVKQEIVLAAVGDASEDIAADGETGHESREHGGDRVCGMTEDLRQHARPDDLVDKAGGTGEKKAEKRYR